MKKNRKIIQLLFKKCNICGFDGQDPEFPSKVIKGIGGDEVLMDICPDCGSNDVDDIDEDPYDDSDDEIGDRDVMA